MSHETKQPTIQMNFFYISENSRYIFDDQGEEYNVAQAKVSVSNWPDETDSNITDLILIGGENGERVLMVPNIAEMPDRFLQDSVNELRDSLIEIGAQIHIEALANPY